jgi:hypothetical protein
MMSYYGLIFKRRDALIEKGAYMARSARDQRWTFKKYLEMRGKYLNKRDEWQRIPGWAQNYVRGYLDGYERMVIDANLEWRVYLDGKHIIGKEVPQGRWVDVEGGKGAYFWIGTDDMYDGPSMMKEVDDDNDNA